MWHLFRMKTCNLKTILSKVWIRHNERKIEFMKYFHINFHVIFSLSLSIYLPNCSQGGRVWKFTFANKGLWRITKLWPRFSHDPFLITETAIAPILHGGGQIDQNLKWMWKKKTHSKTLNMTFNFFRNIHHSIKWIISECVVSECLMYLHDLHN